MVDIQGTRRLRRQRESAEGGSPHLDACVGLGSVPAAASVMLARIRDVDENGPPANQDLFKWLDAHRHRGHRLCEYKVHHPRACRGYAFQTDRGFVMARIDDKTESDQEFNEGEIYE